MPLIRKLIRVGNSRAVIIPPDWIKYFEDKSGEVIDSVLMELNERIIISIEEPDAGQPEGK